MKKDLELLEAARTGDILHIQRLLIPPKPNTWKLSSFRLKSRVNVNCRDPSGYTPLHHAALNGHQKVVQFLLEHSASANCGDVKGSFPLHLASWNGHHEIVEILLTQGPSIAKVNEKNGDNETSLHCAAQHGHSETAQVLLKNGADPSVRNIRSESPLDLASLYGRLEVVRLLLFHQPSLLKRFPESFSPLHVASRNGHKEIVELLIVHGADVNRNGENGSALHEAALFGKLEVVKLLLTRGADPHMLDPQRRSALELVKQLDTQTSRDISKLILERMQDGDDYEPLTAVHKLQGSTTTELCAPPSPLPSLQDEAFTDGNPRKDPDHPSIKPKILVEDHGAAADETRSPVASVVRSNTFKGFSRGLSRHIASRSGSNSRRSVSFRNSKSLPRLPSASRSLSTTASPDLASRFRQFHPSSTMFPASLSTNSGPALSASLSVLSLPAAISSHPVPTHRDDVKVRPAINPEDDNVFLPYSSPTSLPIDSNTDPGASAVSHHTEAFVSEHSTVTPEHYWKHHGYISDDSPSTDRSPSGDRGCKLSSPGAKPKKPVRQKLSLISSSTPPPIPPKPACLSSIKRPPSPSQPPPSDEELDSSTDDDDFPHYNHVTNSSDDHTILAHHVTTDRSQESARVDVNFTDTSATPADSSAISYFTVSGLDLDKSPLYSPPSPHSAMMQISTTLQNVISRDLDESRMGDDDVSIICSALASASVPPTTASSTEKQPCDMGDEAPVTNQYEVTSPSSHQELGRRAPDLHRLSQGSENSGDSELDNTICDSTTCFVRTEVKEARILSTVSESKDDSEPAKTVTSCSGEEGLPPPESISAPLKDPAGASTTTSLQSQDDEVRSGETCEWDDSLSDRTEDFEIPRHIRKFRGLTRGSFRKPDMSLAASPFDIPLHFIDDEPVVASSTDRATSGKAPDHVARSGSPPGDGRLSPTFTTNGDELSGGLRTGDSPATNVEGKESDDVSLGKLPDLDTIKDTVAAVRSRSQRGSGSSSSTSSTPARTLPPKKDEWAQIANAMSTVGEGLKRGSVYAKEFEETFWKIMTGSIVPPNLGSWLAELGLPRYEAILSANGFDDLRFLGNLILEEQDLIDMEIVNPQHRIKILAGIDMLPKPPHIFPPDSTSQPHTVSECLAAVDLSQYASAFALSGCDTVTQLRAMSCDQFRQILSKRGHHKRMMVTLQSNKVSSLNNTVTSQTSSPRSPLLETFNLKEHLANQHSVRQAIINSAESNFAASKNRRRKSSSERFESQASDRQPHASCLIGGDSTSSPLRRSSESAATDLARSLTYKSEVAVLLEHNSIKKSSHQMVSAKRRESEKENRNMNSTPHSSCVVPAPDRALYLASLSQGINLRPPNEATREVSVSAWRHSQDTLINSCCSYQAYYLGSMLIHELKGVESTKEACSKMKKSTNAMKKIPTITLSINYAGVKFIDFKSKLEIAEHEVHNISFASQDSIDLSTFAYVTHDVKTGHHYCHVFRVTTMDMAYEIILTLGQAFEIAYQLIMKEKTIKDAS